MVLGRGLPGRGPAPAGGGVAAAGPCGAAQAGPARGGTARAAALPLAPLGLPVSPPEGCPAREGEKPGGGGVVWVEAAAALGPQGVGGGCRSAGRLPRGRCGDAVKGTCCLRKKELKSPENRFWFFGLGFGDFFDCSFRFGGGGGLVGFAWVCPFFQVLVAHWFYSLRKVGRLGVSNARISVLMPSSAECLSSV